MGIVRVGQVQRFSCTQCGKCCNRSPEVLLSEAGSLSDTFIFRLMFRLYWLPQQPSDSPSPDAQSVQSKAEFFEKKRLLTAFAAQKWPVKIARDGKRAAYTKYLMISALTLDTSPGTCGALQGRQCGIYNRRPLSCRSVPFHYSHAEAKAEAALEAFTGTDGFLCDTSDSAPVVLDDGRIVAPEAKAARSDAVALAKAESDWSAAIARRLNGTFPYGTSLPSLGDIEANAHRGAMTTSMRIAWQIAADAGLMTAEERDMLVQRQLQAIGREIASRRCAPDARQTLIEMQAEYRQHLSGGRAIALNR